MKSRYLRSLASKIVNTRRRTTQESTSPKTTTSAEVDLDSNLPRRTWNQVTPTRASQFTRNVFKSPSRPTVSRTVGVPTNRHRPFLQITTPTPRSTRPQQHAPTLHQNSLLSRSETLEDEKRRFLALVQRVMHGDTNEVIPWSDFHLLDIPDYISHLQQLADILCTACSRMSNPTRCRERFCIRSSGLNRTI